MFIRALAFSLFLITINSCSGSTSIDQKSTEITATQEAKDYWFNGQAELTSFKIQQARYGEIREGYAVMIFVTEDFSTSKFSKTDSKGKNIEPVLKLNFTKNFITGVYPYSIMTSTFIPFDKFDHAHKITATVQEWCGQVYMEMVRNAAMNFQIKSYFEDETIESQKIETTWMEDELFSIIRLYPEQIPTGQQKMIPSFTYLRLMHAELKSYDCQISKNNLNDSTSQIALEYKELNRKVEINYHSSFPYQIYSWNETYLDGFGENKKVLTSSGTKIKTIRLDYWKRNSINDEYLRKELGLE